MTKITDQEALNFHSTGRKGKVETGLSKSLTTARELSLAYSPGVGAVCMAIKKDPDAVYEYTAKGNFVAVITNGTAVLGYGDIGCAAAKPVMEGKSALFKRFADVDAVDIEVNTKDTQEFINTVKNIGATWGGINLEDIKAPECFIIEQELRKSLDIPVFHDDQHGTAIVVLAGVINALHLTKRNAADVKIVVNGAGAASIACIELLKSFGIGDQNITLCDTKGVIYKGRTDGMNPWKSKHAVDTKARSLTEAFVGADIFLGLSAKGVVNANMIKSMNNNPIVFAMANPDPEITPEEVLTASPEAIVATGRSDYPNQINNVMGFPYIFRGALDVRASQITEEMKIAAAKTMAELARESVPDSTRDAYAGSNLEFGREYIIPKPFDDRLITRVSIAVAQAAIKCGVARRPIKDWKAYTKELQVRTNPVSNIMNIASEIVIAKPKTLLLAEGEEAQSIIAANRWCDDGHGQAILIGREDRIQEAIASNKLSLHNKVKIVNAATKIAQLDEYITILYNKQQRNGLLLKDCQRIVKTDRYVFGSLMLKLGEADCMIGGLTQGYANVMPRILQVIDVKDNEYLLGLSVIISKNRVIFVADTSLPLSSANGIDYNDEDHMIKASLQMVNFVRKLGIKPHVAFVAPVDFDHEQHNALCYSKIMEKLGQMQTQDKKIDFTYEAGITTFAAMNPQIAKSRFPFLRLEQEANILIMPDAKSARIAIDFARTLGQCTVIGPVLIGLEHCVQISSIDTSAGNIFNLATIACAAENRK